MKVVVTDYTFPNLEIEEHVLQGAGVNLVAGQCKSIEELIPLVEDADAIITQFAPVKAPVIAAMKRAKVIVRYGIGVDNVDLDTARVRGIPVCNVPDYCIDEVADQTLAFILACSRQVVPNCLGLRNGKWGLATPLNQMHALRNLVVGVIGFGRIGREVVSRLLPFKCRILVSDPYAKSHDIEAMGCTAAGLNQLFESCDVISLHCPSTPQTRGMIGSDALNRMKPGVILINVARGDLVDSDALINSLRNGKVSAAALDVFAPEPIPSDHPILKLDQVVVASHIASTSVPAVRKLRETAAGLARMALEGKPLLNIVNGIAPREV